jgi:predicted outer membrane repeat protein
VLTNCIITNNFANGAGGGADYFDCDNITLKNCTFAKNSANSGGALSCWDSNMAVNSSIFWANQAALGSQVALKTHSSSVVVNYSDVQSGKAAVYVYPGGILNWGSGNIDADPYFAWFDSNGDPNMWDFHLQSAYGRWDPNERRWTKDDVTSLCIDAGDPNSDWSDEPWPNGKRINMGAYGGTIHASMSGSPGDFNIDGLVNFEDFCELAGKWLLEGEFFEDLNSDGAVDVTDLGLFTQTWLWQR